MTKHCCCALVTTLLLVPACADAAIIRVDVHGSGDYATISEGMYYAADGDTVLVAPGTYHEVTALDPGTKNLIVTSGEGPDSTFIDPQQNDRAFHIHGGQDSTMVIEGFTITHGVAGPHGGAVFVDSASPTIRNCVFSDNQAMSSGGAIAAMFGGHPTIVGCAFMSNTAQLYGGAVRTNQGSIALRSCSFFDNTATQGGAAYLDVCSATVDSCTFGSGNVATGATGGGIHCDGGSLTLTNSLFIGCEALSGGGLCASATDPCWVDACDFISNAASQAGGAVYTQFTPIALAGCGFTDNSTGGNGGAAYFHESAAGLNSCTFLENTAASTGGAAVALGSTPVFHACLFMGNSAAAAGAVKVLAFATPNFEDCVFHGNVATSNVGALAIAGSSGWIEGCTLTANRSPGVAGVFFEGSLTTLTRSIIAFSPDGSAMQASSGNPVITHCCVYANAGGDSLGGSHHNNMFLDPLFCGLAGGDLSLCANSFCLPVNNIWFELIGAFPQGCAECLSPVQAVTWGHIKSLYR